MQRTEQNPTRVRVPKGRKVEVSRKRRSDKNNKRLSQPRKPKPLLNIRSIPTHGYTGRFNTSGITLLPKLGFDFLDKKHQTFTLAQKIKAYCIYKCIRHLPGFVDKQFTDSEQAVAYVFREAARVIKKPYQIIYDRSDNNVWRSDSNYYLDIIHEEFFDNMGNGRWNAYGPINDVQDKDLRKLLLMAMNILLYKFHFSTFETDGDHAIMGFDDWEAQESEQLMETLAYAMDEFHNLRKHLKLRKKDVDKYRDDVRFENLIDKIDEALDAITVFNEEVMDYNTNGRELQEAMRMAKPDVSEMMRLVEPFKDSEGGKDLYHWIHLILAMWKRGFCIHDYIPSAAADQNLDDDDERISCLSSFGFIYKEEKDSHYTFSVLQYFNQYAGDIGLMPFSSYTTIAPDRGIIKDAKDTMFMEDVVTLFDFDLSTLSYDK